MSKVLQVDFHDKETENTVTKAVVVVTDIQTRFSAQVVTPPGESKARELDQIANVNVDVYASLSAYKKENVKPVYSSKNFNNIPVNEATGYKTQVLDFLAGTTFKDNNAKIISG